MRRHKAFTLLEVLIALSFSSFIVITIARLLRNASYLLSSSNLSTEVDRRACLIFNQFEQDLSSSTVAKLAEVVKEKPKSTPKGEDEKEGEEATKKSKEEKSTPKKTKEELEKEEKEPSRLFLSTTQETDEIKRKGKKRLQLFKELNFITTNNMAVPNKSSIKPVRVLYSLVLDKEKSKGGKTSYKLIRKETSDVDNLKFSRDKDLFDKKQVTLNEYVIGDNIKSFFVEYYAQKEEEKDPNSKAPTKMKTIRSFTWGDKKDTKNILPYYATIRLELWDQTKTKEYEYNNRIICFAYKYSSAGEGDVQKNKNKEIAKKAPATLQASNQPTQPSENKEQVVQKEQK